MPPTFEKSESSTCSATALEELVALDAHLQFAADLIARHPWGDERSAGLAGTLDGIRARRQDSNLYLAVVGEFSSGKSTLINALIREDLLPTSVLQATTAAATVLRHGPEPCLEVRHRNGDRKTFNFSCHGEAQGVGVDGERLMGLGATLTHFTAVEDVAQRVEQVTVLNPSPVLEKGLVIVDTPGTNVDNPRHVEVACWAIRELCDAAIVLIPANIPLSHDLAEFLSRHLASHLHRCLFIVTMIDRVPAAERELVLRTVESRVESLLGVERPAVLPASPAIVLREIAAEKYQLGGEQLSAEDHRQLLSDFSRMETRIAELLQRQRALILLEHLSGLMARLYDQLGSGLSMIEMRYAEDHRALAENRIVDLAGYAAQRKAEHCETLDFHRTEMASQVLTRLIQVRTRVRTNLKAALDKAATDNDLQQVMKSGVPTALQASKTEMEGSLVDFARDLRQAAAREVAEFEKGFLLLYRSLETLGGRRPPSNAPSAGKEWGITVDGSAAGMGGLASLAEGDQKLDNLLFTGGAVAGAAIGSVMLPVIGTLLGAAVGVFISAMFSPGVDQRRQKYWSQLEPVIDRFFDSAETAFHAALGEIGQTARDEINQAVERYVERYDKLVRQMIDDDEARAAELGNLRRSVKRDAAELARRQKGLMDVQAGLRQIREL